MIVGLHGRKGSGKDAAAAGMPVLRFAGGLKNLTRCLLFQWPEMTDEICERMIEGDLKEKPSPFLLGQTPRQVMIDAGTAFGRECIHPDLWTSLLAAQLEAHERDHPHQLVFVTDVRFENEAQVIRDLGGIVVRIRRSSTEPKKRRFLARLFRRDREHISERPLPARLVDAEIWNDSSIGELRYRLGEAIVRRWPTALQRKAA